MKKPICLFLIICFFSCSKNSEISKDNKLILVSQPIVIEDDDWQFEGTENLIFVPENRNDPKSRKIALHFFKFPAKEKSKLPPVIFLGAGPGESYHTDVFYDGRRAESLRWELNFVNKKRDVILINQRGNPEAPGLPIHNFIYEWSNGGSLNKPFDLKLMNQNRKEGYLKYIHKYTSKGIDLKGYDIIHFIDDIETIRKELDYNKIALIGNSFASQWALGYMQRYPHNVDRAIFSGVEPLDHNYDDPNGIWKVLEKIEEYARNDLNITNDLPKGGLLEAFKTIIHQLEKEPVVVKVGNEEIVVGADDLRFSIMNPMAKGYTDQIESWPKYITEMYYGDFRVLAKTSRGRMYNSSSIIINPLFNNSLGISKEREDLLNSRESVKWLGNINSAYSSTRDICLAPKVRDEFRQHITNDIPVILIQGDMDLSTPYENAAFLMNYLNSGHLITVKRGFHNAKRAIILGDSILANDIYEFMNINFSDVSFQEYKTTLPSVYELPKYTFWPISGQSLFAKYEK
ncbi:alpha/beta fold hydrolase [uncultured Croceitalea sp.]|uniref:alpha/beta fold hydrolase n=1 Tax=uncultured Croceitalea sp. TaxID=1798908 RepID=UPI00330623F2